MKYAGKTIDGPSFDVIVFPRLDGDIVFKCQCVLDYEPFRKICPLPEPPKIMRKGETVYSQNVEDPEYLEKLHHYSELKTHWMVLKSLEATESLEWDTVDFANPETWSNYTDELLKGGFTDSQIAKIINTVAAVNGLNDKMMEEAKKRFLAGQQVQNKQNSLQDEQPST
jgi:hypothetical protein